MSKNVNNDVSKDLPITTRLGRLDYQPLFGKGARGGTQTRYERVTEIEPIPSVDDNIGRFEILPPSEMAKSQEACYSSV